MARFSGTEPLLRIVAEMNTQQEADAVGEKDKQFLEI